MEVTVLLFSGMSYAWAYPECFRDFKLTGERHGYVER